MEINTYNKLVLKFYEYTNGSILSNQISQYFINIENIIFKYNKHFLLGKICKCILPICIFSSSAQLKY